MKNLLEFILLHIVQHPDAIEIEEQETEQGREYNIRVHPEDIGRVIGRHGRTIQAIRTLATVRAMKEDLRVRINVDDDSSITEQDDNIVHNEDAQAEDAQPEDTQVK